MPVCLDPSLDILPVNIPVLIPFSSHLHLVAEAHQNMHHQPENTSPFTGETDGDVTGAVHFPVSIPLSRHLQVAVEPTMNHLKKAVIRPFRSFNFPVRGHPVHYSFITQIDGLIFAIFRLLLERDVCATSPGSSYCKFFGPSWSPASSFCGLSYHTLHLWQTWWMQQKLREDMASLFCPHLLKDRLVLYTHD